MVKSNARYFGYNDWTNRRTNILLITGLSGSGKSTLSNSVIRTPNTMIIELDDIFKFPQCKNQITNRIMASYNGADKGANINTIRDNVQFEKCAIARIGHVINFVSRNKTMRYIIEGVQILYLQGKQLDWVLGEDKSIITMVTPLGKCIENRQNRDGHLKNQFGNEVQMAVLQREYRRINMLLHEFIRKVSLSRGEVMGIIDNRVDRDLQDGADSMIMGGKSELMNDEDIITESTSAHPALMFDLVMGSIHGAGDCSLSAEFKIVQESLDLIEGLEGNERDASIEIVHGHLIKLTSALEMNDEVDELRTGVPPLIDRMKTILNKAYDKRAYAKEIRRNYNSTRREMRKDYINRIKAEKSVAKNDINAYKKFVDSN